jgi:hypothetical protein
LKASLEKLAQALHRAIEGSSDVDEALAGLRAQGLAAVLLLEVTVALSRTDRDVGSDEAIPGPAHGTEDEWLVQLPEPETQAGVEPQVGSDRDFLRSLRIRLD